MQEGTGALRSGLVQLSEGSLLAVEATRSDPRKYRLVGVRLEFRQVNIATRTGLGRGGDLNRVHRGF